jgi:ketosteroid isomerase-like protein
MSTTTEQNKAMIRRFFDAWNSRQSDAFDDLIAPDVVRHCEATPGMEARSLDQVKEFLQQDTAAFPDSVQTIKLLVAEGDLVAAWTTHEAHKRDKRAHFHLRVARRNLNFGAVFRIERSRSGG